MRIDELLGDLEVRGASQVNKRLDGSPAYEGFLQQEGAKLVERYTRLVKGFDGIINATLGVKVDDGDPYSPLESADIVLDGHSTPKTGPGWLVAQVNRGIQEYPHSTRLDVRPTPPVPRYTTSVTFVSDILPDVRGLPYEEEFGVKRPYFLDETGDWTYVRLSSAMETHGAEMRRAADTQQMLQVAIRDSSLNPQYVGRVPLYGSEERQA